ncbi:MAG: S8 family serine peptidase [Pseudomonadota bacterium]
MWIILDVTTAVVVIAIALTNAARVLDRVGGWWSQRPPDLIAPITFASYEIKDNEIGSKLAAMLQSKLENTKHTLSNSTLNFDFSDISSMPSPDMEDNNVTFNHFVAPRVLATVREQLNETNLPVHLFNDTNIELNLSGIDAGPWLRWIYRKIHDERIISILVQKSEESSIVSANFDGVGEPPTVLKVSGTSEAAVIDAINFHLWRREIVRDAPEVSAFTEAEFGKFIQVVEAFVAQQKRERAGRRDESSPWLEIGKDAEKLSRIVPRWGNLHLLAGSAYLRGLNFEAARRSFERARDAKSAFESPDQTAIDSIQAVIDVVTTIDLSEYQEEILNEAEANLLEMMNIDRPNEASGPVISVAVAGGLPPSVLFSLENVERVGSQFSSEEQFHEQDRHAGNVARMVQLVAGSAAQIKVAAMRGSDDTDALVNNLEALVEEEPDVLCVPYAGRKIGVFPDAVMRLLSDAVDAGSVVVLPLANNREGANLMNLPVLSGESGKFMIVSSVDRSGRAADFAKSAPSVLWLPGTAIPEVQSNGTLAFGKGASYSVGLAAGVIARLKAVAAKADAGAIMRALRETAGTDERRAAAAHTDLKPTIDVNAASERLASDGH